MAEEEEIEDPTVLPERTSEENNEATRLDKDVNKVTSKALSIAARYTELFLSLS
ncbi:hypothetical protein LINGRAHAP2_LOCUS3137 [Linum grandiflorum]